MAYATVLVNALNVRELPGTGNRVIGQLSKGQRVQLEARTIDGSWGAITFKGQRGWISLGRDVVTLIGNVEDLAALNLATRAPVVARTARAISATSSSGSGSICPGFQYTCSQLTCAQAYACLAEGNKQLDGNSDGIPCNAKCR
jgi:uncharacterized protein YgiM (DUF1202 family)